METRTISRALTLGAIFLGTAAMQAASPLPLLGGLEAGQWELRGDGNVLISSICLGDPGQLVQPQHLGQACQRSLLGSDAHSVTVRYTCPGSGSGRTSIRVETPRLVQIDSQGLYNGTPFALRAEARRTAACR